MAIRSLAEIASVGGGASFGPPRRRRSFAAAHPFTFAAALAAVATSTTGCGSSGPAGAADEATGSTTEAFIQACKPPMIPVCTAGTAPVCHCGPTPVTVTFTADREYGVQPGWARAIFTSSTTSGDSLWGSVTCGAGTSASSVDVTAKALTATTAAVDIKANESWLAANGFPTPCEVTSVTITARAYSGLAMGSATLTNTFAMDVPLSGLTPSALTAPIKGTSVSLQPAASTRRYLAYPPLIVAIQSAEGRTAFAEVEELPARGSVGLRAMAAFQGPWLDRELGGGAEIYAGWGLDVDLLGVTKVTSGTEESNPGHNAYTTGAPNIPALYFGDPGGEVYPAPPAYSTQEYLAQVLDNRGVPRCNDPKGCLDVVYDQATHTLDAVNGATVEWIEGGPLQPSLVPILAPVLSPVRTLAATRPVAAPTAPKTAAIATDTAATRAADVATASSAATTASSVATSVSSVSSVATTASSVTTATASAPVAMLGASSARVAPVERVQSATPSPEQVEILASLQKPVGSLGLGTSGTCPLSGSTSSVPLTQCTGNTAAFPCPTAADPLRVETFPFPSATSDGLQESLTSMMPQYAGRVNIKDDCETHAQTQRYELLVNRLGADIGTARTVALDGDTIVVPNPLIAYSVAGLLAGLYNWGGTQVGDPDIDPSGTWPTGPGTHQLPYYINGYWPAYEGDWQTWVWGSSTDARARCAQEGYWHSAYCVGQGQPPPGVYWNYNDMLTSEGQSPISAMPWSIGNTYFDVTETDLSLDDRGAAIAQVINTVWSGLPVLMTFNYATQNITDSAGHQSNLLGDTSWFLPPELAACDAATLNAAYNPSQGHAVNIIGYSIVGSLAAPDLFRSYFIIDNNWGKGAGYGGYYMMNFAAFKLLAGRLVVDKLVCDYDSIACSSAL